MMNKFDLKNAVRTAYNLDASISNRGGIQPPISIRFGWLFLLIFFVAVVPDIAVAANTVDDNIIGRTVCAVTNLFTSQVGKGIATLAIVFLGIGAFFGKVNWGLALMVSVGIIGIFGAATIAEYISSEAGEANTTDCRAE